MAENNETANEAPEKKGGKKSFKVMAIVGGVMLLEAVAMVVVMGMIKPSTGEAAVTGDLADDPMEQSVELPVAEGRFQNLRTGRVWIWDLSVFIRVKNRDSEHVTQVLERHHNEIGEGINQIVRRAEHAHLIEPEHRTIRRLILDLLDDVLGTNEDGKSYIEAVIIPTCQGLPADF